MKKKAITAGELMAKLNADPEWVAARAKEDAEIEREEAELRRVEAPLTRELRRVGVCVESAWDLVNSRGSYPPALPILLKHLTRPYPTVVREGIARAMAVPETKDIGWKKLLRLYRSETDDRVKEAIGAALCGAADDEVVDDVIRVVRDPRNGRTRIIFLSALEHSKEPRARVTLMALGTDPELREEIQATLKRLQRKTLRKKKASR